MTSTALDRPLTPMETFQKNLADKIRQDIAEMVPPEVINEMAARVINDEFFKVTQRNTGSSWNPVYVNEPTPFQKEVLAACRPLINLAVAQVLADRKATIDAQIAELVKGGLVKLTINAFDAQIENRLSVFLEDVKGAMKDAITSNNIRNNLNNMPDNNG